MKRILAIFLISICIATTFSGKALAGSAPDAMSYFTNESYNKTYLAGDGLEHHMSVKWVGETWNKVGTVIYSINYEDVYQNGDNSYIDVKSATEIYENARPTYPDCSEFSVYQVKWYLDGGKQVISDYRTSATPAPTAKPTATSTPTVEPTNTQFVTNSPTVKHTNKPTVEPTITPYATPTSEPSSTNILITPSQLPQDTEAVDIYNIETTIPIEEELSQSFNARWVLTAALLLVIVASMLILRKKRSKGGQ